MDYPVETVKMDGCPMKVSEICVMEVDVLLPCLLLFTLSAFELNTCQAAGVMNENDDKQIPNF